MRHPEPPQWSQDPESECCHLQQSVSCDPGSGYGTRTHSNTHWSWTLLVNCRLKLSFACEVWGWGRMSDEHEGEFVIQTEEEPNESPPLLPRRFLWPLVAGLQVPWSVVSIDGGQQLTSGEWGAWHPPPGWCQTSTTSHWLHWAALISTCKWYWEQHFSFRKITGNVE